MYCYFGQQAFLRMNNAHKCYIPFIIVLLFGGPAFAYLKSIKLNDFIVVHTLFTNYNARTQSKNITNIGRKMAVVSSSTSAL